jgi:CRISPR system Cascade subunit CasC
MLVELHLIQNFTPSCLNRDDTNTPKDCEFGGYRRARISSQCIKRSIRKSDVFRETVEQGLGVRTKLLVNQLMERLVQAGKNTKDVKAIVPTFVTNLISKLDKEKTAVLLYLGDDEIERMKGILISHWGKLTTAARKAEKKAETALDEACKEAVKGFKSGTKAADIALFGRMMAERPEFAIDAACQVAHAISTNRVLMEMDFYTAVDDLPLQGETGAAMMGVTGYNSSCFYRYSLVDLRQLKANLGSDEPLARKALEAFLKASVTAIPTGKQTSMAAQNPPDAILAVVRSRGAPMSLANAFAVPVRQTMDKSLTQASMEAMDGYWGKLVEVYGQDGVKACPICLVQEADLKVLKRQQVTSFEELMKVVMGSISFKEGK